MARQRRIYEGKTKDLFEGPEPGTLVQHFRDELILLLLIAVGAFVYAFLILALFGRGWLFALRRV